MSKVSRIVDVLGTDTISGFLYKKLFVSIFKVKRGVTILVGVIPILYTKTAFSQTILIAICQDTRFVIVQVTLPVSFLLVRLNKGVSRSSTLLKRTTTLLFGLYGRTKKTTITTTKIYARLNGRTQPSDHDNRLLHHVDKEDNRRSLDF